MAVLHTRCHQTQTTVFKLQLFHILSVIVGTEPNLTFGTQTNDRNCPLVVHFRTIICVPTQVIKAMFIHVKEHNLILFLRNQSKLIGHFTNEWMPGLRLIHTTESTTTIGVWCTCHAAIILATRDLIVMDPSKLVAQRIQRFTGLFYPILDISHRRIHYYSFSFSSVAIRFVAVFSWKRVRELINFFAPRRSFAIPRLPLV